MAKQVYEVVGVKKSKSSKSGKDCFNYFLKCGFSDYDLENAECQGETVTSEFSYEDFGVKPGDHVQLEYEKGFQDRATLCGMIPVRNPYPADGNKQDKPKQ